MAELTVLGPHDNLIVEEVDPGRAWLVPSKSKPWPRRVERLPDGRLRCSCPRGWKTCRHKAAIEEILRETAPLVPPLPTVPMIVDPDDGDPFAGYPPVVAPAPSRDPSTFAHPPTMAELVAFWEAR